MKPVADGERQAQQDWFAELEDCLRPTCHVGKQLGQRRHRCTEDSRLLGHQLHQREPDLVLAADLLRRPPAHAGGEAGPQACAEILTARGRLGVEIDRVNRDSAGGQAQSDELTVRWRRQPPGAAPRDRARRSPLRRRVVNQQPSSTDSA